MQIQVHVYACKCIVRPLCRARDNISIRNLERGLKRRSGDWLIDWMYSATSVLRARRIVCVWVCLVVRVYVWCRIDWFWLRFSVLIEMTISFLSFRLGPWDDLGIYNRAVPVEVEIHKRAILVQIALSWISQPNNQNQSIWCVCEESPSIRVATISRQKFFSEDAFWKEPYEKMALSHERPDHSIRKPSFH